MISDFLLRFERVFGRMKGDGRGGETTGGVDGGDAQKQAEAERIAAEMAQVCGALNATTGRWWPWWLRPSTAVPTSRPASTRPSSG